MAAPESWIGRHVVLGLENTRRPVPGDLLEVSDRGLVLDAYPHDDLPPDTTPPARIFYPWRIVHFVKLALEEHPSEPV